MALMVTVVTNGICFVVTPLWLLLITSQAVSIDVAKMIKTLGMLVVLPMVVAQLARLISPLARFADLRKVQLGIAAQFGMWSIVAIGAVYARRSLLMASFDGALPWADLAVMTLLVILLHGLGLLTGLALAAAAGIGSSYRIAVAIAGSQKTLMLGL